MQKILAKKTFRVMARPHGQPEFQYYGKPTDQLEHAAQTLWRALRSHYADARIVEVDDAGRSRPRQLLQK